MSETDAMERCDCEFADNELECYCNRPVYGGPVCKKCRQGNHFLLRPGLNAREVEIAIQERDFR